MLHEVLLALVGHCGNIIHQKATAPGDQIIGFELNKEIDLHPSERAVITHIVQLGSLYVSLATMVRRHTWSLQSLDVAPASLYLQALSCGIEEVLEAYRHTVAECETVATSDVTLPLLSITNLLSQYHLLFPALLRLCSEVESRGLVGGPLLALLESTAVSGIPIVQVTVTRLLWHCRRVMLSMMSAWCVYCRLLDPATEFFIQEDVASARQDGGMDWSRQYTVSLVQLPPSVSLRMAEKILFIGKAVNVLSQGHGLLNASLEGDSVLQKSAAIMSISRSPASVSRKPSNVDRDTLRAERLAITQHLRQELVTFHSTLASVAESRAWVGGALETAIDRMRRGVAKSLWDFIVIQSNLVSSLNSLKNYFLLGKGDFWTCFIEESSVLMSSPPGPAAKHEVKTPFFQAALKSTADRDDSFAQFSPCLSLAGKDKVATVDEWRVLSLEYRCDWPMHLLLDQTSLQLYGRLFRFLLTLKRVHWSLEQAWMAQMGTKNHPLTQARDDARVRLASTTSVWLLLSEMLHLVATIQYHLLVDVLETQWDKLVQYARGDDSPSSKDFEHLFRAHQLYLLTLEEQCFQHHPTVGRVLDDIFNLCLSFARRTTIAYARTGVDSHGDTSVGLDQVYVTKTRREFRRYALFFITVLGSSNKGDVTESEGSVNDRGHVSRLVSQLVLRLDYNSFFSTVVEGQPA